MSIFEQVKESVLDNLAKSTEQADKLQSLGRALSFVQVSSKDIETILSVLKLDPEHPYSRNVLYNEDNLEIMVARWTRDVPCHPHDHGASYSAILILDGCSEHKLYRIQDDELVCVHTEYKHKGDVILCAPHQIHSMGGYPNLITVHVYTEAISNMLVFDKENKQTFLVDGGCGAWLPVDNPDMIVGQKKGYVRRDSFERSPT